jgi:flagellar hook-associated protein 2
MMFHSPPATNPAGSHNKTSLKWNQEAFKGQDNNASKLFSGSTVLSNQRALDDETKMLSRSLSRPKTNNAPSKSSLSDEDFAIDKFLSTSHMQGVKLSRDQNGNIVTGNTKITDLMGKHYNPNKDMSFTVKVDGKETKINMTANTKISDIVNQLKNAGLKAFFCKENNRFSISSKNSGKEGEFSLIANDLNGFNAINAMGIRILDKNKYADLAGLMDKDGNIVNKAEFDRLVQIDIDKKRKEEEEELKANEDAIKAIEARMKAQLEAYKEYLVAQGKLSEREADALDINNRLHVEQIFRKIDEAKEELYAELGSLNPSDPDYASKKAALERELGRLKYDRSDYSADKDEVAHLENVNIELKRRIKDPDAKAYRAEASEKLKKDILYAQEVMSGLAGGGIPVNEETDDADDDRLKRADGITVDGNDKTNSYMIKHGNFQKSLSIQEEILLALEKKYLEQYKAFEMAINL